MLPKQHRAEVNYGGLNAQATGIIEEVYAGNTIVKAFNQESTMERKFELVNRRLFKAIVKVSLFSAFFSTLILVVKNSTKVFVCIVAGVIAIQIFQEYGYEKMLLFVAVIPTFLLFCDQFVYPLTQFSEQLLGLVKSAPAIRRVNTLLNYEEVINSKTKPAFKKQLVGDIEFDHVSFSYQNDYLSLADFSLKVKNGQKVAIVGETGAGKTTLLNLLLKFYEPTSGKISINNIDFKEINNEDLRMLYGVVLQEPWLFSGTLRENLLFGCKNKITDQKIYQILKSIGISDFVKQLSQKLDTVINENTQISNGQKQLLTIARALIRDPQIIILDEATSNVDTLTEIKVKKACDEMIKNRTTFIVAHRLSTVINADLIIVLKNGKIFEQGTHQQLLNKKGMYAELYNSQFIRFNR
jgi:ATP-binding cassette subfamily B protein